MGTTLINNVLYMFLNTFMVAYFVTLTNYDYKNYDTFLKKRRILMAKYIKDYYESL